MNKRFSDRMGITKPRDTIQLESMDDALRNGLWNKLHDYYWSLGNASGGRVSLNGPDNYTLRNLCILIIEDHFKGRKDQLDSNFINVKADYENKFFKGTWSEAYNFIEFVGNNGWPDERNRLFQKACNEVLGKEMSGYRFVGGVITPISNSDELESIEEALSNCSDPVKEHLITSLSFLSDRQSPDYRNSIKESIFAVESLASKIVGDKPELSKLLRKLKEKITLHRSLEKAFEKLYSFTSDAGGMRHAITDESVPIDFHDAKFMLIACSAFINYINGKLEE